jgi:hypothetical protein
MNMQNPAGSLRLLHNRATSYNTALRIRPMAMYFKINSSKVVSAGYLAKRLGVWQ